MSESAQQCSAPENKIKRWSAPSMDMLQLKSSLALLLLQTASMNWRLLKDSKAPES